MWRPLLLLLLCFPLLAQNVDESDGYTLKNWLAADAKSDLGFGRSMWAMGYVEGVVETGEGRFFCTPGNARQAEFDQVVIKYLDEHPNRLHDSRGMVAVQALHDAFPCKK